MATRELNILISAKNMASKVLGQVKGDVNGLEGAAKRAGSNMGRNIGIGVAGVGAGLAVQVKAGVDSLVELERVENLTAAALASTGNVAKQSAEGIRARAEAMENLTGVDDKAIQNAQNLLLTFTNVTEDAFEPTLEAALNLNAALGGDDESLQGVLLQVGKAINDPVRGMTALRRSGVSFTEAQQDQVKAMLAANDMMGAQALILGELETQFGDAAEKANEGVGGSQKAFADAIEDMQMALATGFLPLIERVSDKMGTLVGDKAFLQGVEDFGSTMAGAFDEAIDFAEDIPWAQVGSALSIAGTGAKAAMDAFKSAPAWLQTAILTGWGLNKLTGGGLGSLGGSLGTMIGKWAAQKLGLMTVQAGVVNVNGGLGGPTGPNGKPGGKLPFIGPTAAVALPLMMSGSDNPDADPVASQQVQLQQLHSAGLLTDATFRDLWARAYAGENISSELNSITAETRNSTAAIVAAQDRAATSGAAGFIGLSQKTMDVANAQRSEGAMARTAMTGIRAEVAAKGSAQVSAQYEALSAVRATQTPLNTIAAKNFSPTVNVTANVNSFVSIQEWQRTAQSAQTAFSTNSGGF